MILLYYFQKLKVKNIMLKNVIGYQNDIVCDEFKSKKEV